MQREEQAALIKILLIGEILFAISSIAFLGLFVPGMIFISFLSVFGLGMIIFAAVRLQEAAKEFKLSFIAAIIALILAIVSDILFTLGIRANGGDGNSALIICASVFSALEILTSIYVVFQTLKGCRVLISQVDPQDKFGYRTTIIYGALAAVAIGLSIAIAAISDEMTVKILSSVLVGIDIAAAVVYVIALIRTHNYLS